MATEKRGAQEPRLKIEQKYKETDGEDAGFIASEYGLKPDTWQQMLLNAWLARDKKDNFVHRSCGLSVPRQNGKNAVLEMRELYGLIAMSEIILHTSHRVDTSRKAFLRLCSFFENEREYPLLAQKVKQIRRTNGQEAILLWNGGSIEFSARTRGGARGASYGLVVFDEAQELTEEQTEAIIPTLAASRGQRQFIYTGTPPSINAPGDVFANVRKSAFRKNTKNLCWYEWSVEEIGDVTDKKRWYATNPALGIRLDEKFTYTELQNLTEEGFARERLGWWQTTSGKTIFKIEDWENLGIDKAEDTPQDGKLGIGIKFSVDGATVSVVACLKPKNEKPYIEGIFNKSMREGVSWLSDWLYERKNEIAMIEIDGRAYTDTLIAQLIERGYPKKGISLAGTRGVVAAATRFYNAYKEKSISHFNQPALNSAIEHATRRNIGTDGGWGFLGLYDTDITLVEAASLAYHGAMTTKRNPKRKARVW